MHNKMFQLQKTAALLLCLGLASSASVYAEGFYTIIGPDGRPMIVPKKATKKSLAAPMPVKNTAADSSVSQAKNTVKAAVPVPTVTVPVRENPSVVTAAIPSTSSITQAVPTVTVAKKQPIKTTPPEAAKLSDSPVQVLVPKQKNMVIAPAGTTVQPVPTVAVEKKPPIATTQLEAPQLPNKTAQSPATTHSAGFSNVDGVEYVNSEYLEDQEFNLEGKKRFYSMPDGTGRFETIERKKGVSRAVLDKFLNRNQTAQVPIALSGTYMRLSAQDLSVAFENDRCFLSGYKKNIKTLSPIKEVGLWPTQPLKEKFEYELVKLEGTIEYAQIDSYAKTQAQPTYYWPLIVFLDQNGCALEGVSGFKNSTQQATFLQHAAIQGVIKVPAQTRYMMMTPLASAIDMPEQALSNQGQIKLTALK